MKTLEETCKSPENNPPQKNQKNLRKPERNPQKNPSGSAWAQAITDRKQERMQFEILFFLVRELSVCAPMPRIGNHRGFPKARDVVQKSWLL